MPSVEPLHPDGVALLLLAILGPPGWRSVPGCCAQLGGLCDGHRSRLIAAVIKQRRGVRRLPGKAS